MAADWPLAEIFVKTGRAQRCEFGPLGIRALRSHRETGVAIRVWDREGREGRVHADAVGIRRDEDLIERARVAATAGTPGPLPRLPAGRSDDPPPGTGGIERAPATMGAMPADPAGAEQVLDFANRLVGGFSAAGREAVSLVHGWVETGCAAQLVVNGLGREVSWSTGIVSVCLQVGGAAPGPSAGTHLLRYTAHAARPDEMDPALIVHEAAWRAAAALGGAPVEGSGVRVVLDPRGAAAWLRSLAPLFVRAPGLMMDEAPATAADGAPAIPSEEPLDLGTCVEIDDDPVSPAFPPPAVGWDGEGRALARRVLVRDGAVYAVAGSWPTEAGVCDATRTGTGRSPDRRAWSSFPGRPHGRTCCGTWIRGCS